MKVILLGDSIRLGYGPVVEEELKKKEHLLNDIPLYREYINTVDEINNTYNIIENRINKYFMDKLN